MKTESVKTLITKSVYTFSCSCGSTDTYIHRYNIKLLWSYSRWLPLYFIFPMTLFCRTGRECDHKQERQPTGVWAATGRWSVVRVLFLFSTLSGGYHWSLSSVSDLSLTATIVLGDQSHVWRYFLKIRTSATQQLQ